MPEVTLFTRKNCHLCEEAKEILAEERAKTPFTYEEIDVDSDPALAKKYGEEVPVIEIHGKKAFKYRIDDIKRFHRLLRTP